VAVFKTPVVYSGVLLTPLADEVPMCCDRRSKPVAVLFRRCSIECSVPVAVLWVPLMLFRVSKRQWTIEKHLCSKERENASGTIEAAIDIAVQAEDRSPYFVPEVRWVKRLETSAGVPDAMVG